jgi:hypothetical protein
VNTDAGDMCLTAAHAIEAAAADSAGAVWPNGRSDGCLLSVSPRFRLHNLSRRKTCTNNCCRPFCNSLSERGVTMLIRNHFREPPCRLSQAPWAISRHGLSQFSCLNLPRELRRDPYPYSPHKRGVTGSKPVAPTRFS